MSASPSTSRPKRQGRFWPMDEQGRILNDASAECIDPQYRRAIAQALDAYRRNLKDDLHSVHVTGSVARGVAEPGRSSLDMMAVLQPGVDLAPRHTRWLAIAGDAALAGQCAARTIELTVRSWSDVFPGTDRFSWHAFVLATGAVCVAGWDLEGEVPRLPPCPAIANADIVRIETALSEAREALAGGLDPADVRTCCQAIARTILHTAYALVMLEEAEHTRDLDLARDLFLLHYPERHGDIARAFNLTGLPTGDPETVIRFIDRVRGWMVPMANRWLDRHNPGRAPALRLPATLNGGPQTP